MPATGGGGCTSPSTPLAPPLKDAKFGADYMDWLAWLTEMKAFPRDPRVNGIYNVLYPFLLHGKRAKITETSFRKFFI